MRRNITPKIVAIRRMIPVIQAKVSLTKATSAIMINSGESFASCRKRADCRVFTVNWNIFSCSESTLPLWAMIPTSFPAKRLISVSQINANRRQKKICKVYLQTVQINFNNYANGQTFTIIQEEYN